MKHGPGLLLIALLGMSCSQSNPTAQDQGSITQDLGTQGDLGVPPDAEGSGKTMLNLVTGGLGGSGNVDGTGSAARFNGLRGLAPDGSGNLYIADINNHTIRKVVLASGVVTTLAGLPGMTGSADGTGAAARFNAPHGLACDGNGNLYVADTFNHTIRKVVLTSGVVTTLAGMAAMPGSLDGTGNAARFNGPRGVATDGAGNLYVLDTGNSTIRKVVLASGVVTTLAGTAGMQGSADATGSAARFNLPQGLSADGAGNLYVADTQSSTIRQVVIATSAVTTLAGTAGMQGSLDGTGGAARFTEPFGVAVDGAGNLYVADTFNYTLRKVVIATGITTTLAGTAGRAGSTDGTGAAARFNQPFGVAVAGAGNLYVADTSNNTLRKVVASSGAVSTFAGAPSMPGSADGTGNAARCNGPRGVAVAGADNLYVADTGNSTIRKVVLSTGATTTLAGAAGRPGSLDGTGAAAQFNAPRSVALDGAGNLYVTDQANHTIRKVVIATGVTTTLAGTAGMAGNLDGTGAAAQFSLPSGLTVDGAGNLYVVDTNNDTIRKVVIASGAVTTVAGLAGMAGRTDGNGSAARFDQPSGLTGDGAGILYIADTNNQTIRKLVLSTGAVTTLAGAAGMTGSTDGTGSAARFNQPYDLTLGSPGNLYVTDTGNGTIRQIRLASADVTTLVGVAGQQGVKPGPLPASLNQPLGIAALPTGILYLTDRFENAVLAVR